MKHAQYNQGMNEHVSQSYHGIFKSTRHEIRRTTMEQVKDAPNAIDTLLLQPWQSDKTKKYVKNVLHQPATPINIPMGLEWSDDFLMTVSELTGKPIPKSLE